MPFFEGYKFCEWSKKGVCGNYFHETTLAALFTIHVNLHAMEFLLIFGETNFVEVAKFTKFTALKKRASYSNRVHMLRIELYFPLLLPVASFDMKISVDGLFFIGSQLVTLSYTGKVAVWQSMTQHWQVITSLYLCIYLWSLKWH